MHSAAPLSTLPLQKHVKRLPFKEQLGQRGTLESLTEEENKFCKALSDTLHQLNDMFLAKEETSVIRVERLEHDLAAATTPEQLNNLHKQFVDFHGEVLLLVHWSILAYTATVKILKKHHKRTGLLVKAPQLGNLLSQPFCSTEVRLVCAAVPGACTVFMQPFATCAVAVDVALAHSHAMGPGS
eukprot:GHUV01041556.1.p1 GENE.GHUV01041556.1~~GHUV01041556.1.p1  ORF type:complete len:184 (-),score=43.34 GHUV01041556.1:9-560(-)